MLHPRGTITQQFLWGNKPAIFWGGSNVLESCYDLIFRMWSKEPGKGWTNYGGCVCTCVYFHITSDHSVKGVRISEEPHVLQLLAQKLVWSIYNSRQLILNIKHRILTPNPYSKIGRHHQLLACPLYYVADVIIPCSLFFSA